jgi:hypothetical protein
MEHRKCIFFRESVGSVVMYMETVEIVGWETPCRAQERRKVKRSGERETGEIDR